MISKIIGYLHDIVEDKHIEKQYIINEFGIFGEYLWRELKLLTHKPKVSDEEYLKYIDNITEYADYYTIEVKKADLQHNINLSRLNNITDIDIKRKTKYEKALNKLNKIDLIQK